jgi:hypothetical protein
VSKETHLHRETKRLHTHMYCTSMHAHTNMYMHTQTHMYAHTHTHICACIPVEDCSFWERKKFWHRYRNTEDELLGLCSRVVFSRRRRKLR